MKGGRKEGKNRETKVRKKEREKEDWRGYILTWGLLKHFYCIYRRRCSGRVLCQPEYLLGPSLTYPI